MSLCAPAMLAAVLLASAPEPEAQAAAPLASPAPLRIPAGTPVSFEFVDRVHSRLNKIGDRFRIRLREPLVVEGRTVLPGGAEGVGEVIHAARARAAGKAGELILAARYLDHGGTRVPLRAFRFGASGTDNRDAAFAVGLAAGPLAYLVVGGELDIKPGTPGHAKVAADVEIPPAAVAPDAPVQVQPEEGK